MLRSGMTTCCLVAAVTLVAGCARVSGNLAPGLDSGVDGSVKDGAVTDVALVDATPKDSLRVDATPMDSSGADSKPTDSATADSTPIDSATGSDAGATDGPIAPISYAHCAVTTAWDLLTPPNIKVSDLRLTGVWGTSADRVWIVGSGTNGSARLRLDGAWTREELTGTLTKLWGSSPNDIWAVGYNGALAHYDGKQWTASRFGTEWYRDIWGISATEMWMVSSDGGLFEKTSTGWNELYRSGGRHFEGVWADSAKNIWVVGATNWWRDPNRPTVRGFRFRYDPVSLKIEPHTPDSTGTGIWGYEGTVWAVHPRSGDNVVRNDNRQGWKPDPIVGEGPWGIWGSTRTDMWVTGSIGKLFWNDGVKWTTVQVPGSRHLWTDIMGTPDGTLWVVGDDGGIARCVRP